MEVFIASLSVRDLKDVIASAGLDTSGCIDKADLIQRCREAIAKSSSAGTAPPPAGEQPAAAREPPPACAPVAASAPAPATSSTSESVAVDEILRTRADPYKSLGVAVDATDVEIKKAFRKRCLHVHPDKCSHPSATVAFQVINDAFAVLSDASKRAALDQARSAQQQWSQQQAAACAAANAMNSQCQQHLVVLMHEAYRYTSNVLKAVLLSNRQLTSGNKSHLADRLARFVYARAQNNVDAAVATLRRECDHAMCANRDQTQQQAQQQAQARAEAARRVEEQARAEAAHRVEEQARAEAARRVDAERAAKAQEQEQARLEAAAREVLRQRAAEVAARQELERQEALRVSEAARIESARAAAETAARLESARRAQREAARLEHAQRAAAERAAQHDAEQRARRVQAARESQEAREAAAREAAQQQQARRAQAQQLAQQQAQQLAQQRSQQQQAQQVQQQALPTPRPQQAAPQPMQGYRCGRCGLQKKGHVCCGGAAGAAAQPTPENGSSTPTAAAGATAPSKAAPPLRQVTVQHGKKHKRPFGDVVGDNKRRQMTMSDFFGHPAHSPTPHPPTSLSASAGGMGDPITVDAAEDGVVIEELD